MAKFALLVRFEAKKGKESEVEAILKSSLPLVMAEPTTRNWYALKFGPSTFGIYDTFDNEEGRDAHLGGKVAANLMANLKVDPATALLADGSLLAVPPVIEKVDLLGSK